MLDIYLFYTFFSVFCVLCKQIFILCQKIIQTKLFTRRKKRLTKHVKQQVYYPMEHVYISKVPESVVSHSAVAVVFLPFRLLLDPWAASKSGSLKDEILCLCIVTLPTDFVQRCALLACTFQRNCFFATPTEQRAMLMMMMMIVWQYETNERKKKTFNAMMSHYLIQAFAEHEKSFCRSLKYFLLCLFHSNTLLGVAAQRRRRCFWELFSVNRGTRNHLRQRRHAVSDENTNIS